MDDLKPLRQAFQKAEREYGRQLTVVEMAMVSDEFHRPTVQDDRNTPVWSHTSLQKAQTTQNRNITWQERAGMAILIAMALAGVWVIAWGMGL